MAIFIGIYNLPLAVTMSGLFFGVTACFLSAGRHLEGAVICFILAGLCDLFDGVVARRVDRGEDEKIFGLYVDSTVDAVNFGAVPVVMLLNWGLVTFLDYLLLFFYCFCAVIRLSYFNLLKRKEIGPAGYYIGLPVTYSALVLPVVLAVATMLPRQPAIYLVRLSIFCLGLFYVMKLPVKKPGGVFYVIFPILGALLIAFWLFTALH